MLRVVAGLCFKHGATNVPCCVVTILCARDIRGYYRQTMFWRAQEQPKVPWCGGKTHRLRLYVERCCRSKVDCISCEAKAVSFVEHTEPLSPPFEVNQAQPLLQCFSFEPGFVLSDIRLFSSLEAIVKSGRGESLWECSPLLPSLNAHFVRHWNRQTTGAGGGVSAKEADSAEQLPHVLDSEKQPFDMLCRSPR